MFNLKQTNLILLAIITIFSGMYCRGPVIPTEEDLADYGWVIYEEGNYEEAREWFRDALDKDPSYADGYNGLGWCFGKMRQADSAIYYFSLADTLAYDPFETPDLDLDVYAGFTFAYNGLGLDTLVREYAGYFFGNQNIDEGELWIFSHDSKINYMDVRLVQALAEFTMGYFQLAIESVEQIYRDMDIPKNLQMDINTVVGRAELAAELEYLQNILKNQ